MFSDESGFFEAAIFQTTGTQAVIRSTKFVSGGCINNTLKIETDHGPFFLKWNDDEDNDMFEKEALGLELLNKQGVISLPATLGTGRIQSKNYLVLEYLEKHPPKTDFWEDFGTAIARLHKITSSKYGLDHDNYIGKLPQNNSFKDSWIDFFIEKRLEVQLGLAIYNNQIDQEFAKKFRMIYAQLPGLLPNEPPSLLHGDLWSGNFMSGKGGNPFIFDPAVYFGHREMELAFSRLFGGFDRQFYQSYNVEYPIEPGFDNRIDIYNLYPLLVHVNLFGASYLSGIERTLRRYL